MIAVLDEIKNIYYQISKNTEPVFCEVYKSEDDSFQFMSEIDSDYQRLDHDVIVRMSLMKASQLYLTSNADQVSLTYSDFPDGLDQFNIYSKKFPIDNGEQIVALFFISKDKNFNDFME